MGKISSALMVTLAVAAMLWGNCLSCPNRLAAQQSDHSCCHKPKPAPTPCHTEDLQQFVQVERHASAAPAMAVAAELTAAYVPVRSWISTTVTVWHAPPELTRISTSLRV